MGDFGLSVVSNPQKFDPHFLGGAGFWGANK